MLLVYGYILIKFGKIIYFNLQINDIPKTLIFFPVATNQLNLMLLKQGMDLSYFERRYFGKNHNSHEEIRLVRNFAEVGY